MSDLQRIAESVFVVLMWLLACAVCVASLAAALPVCVWIARGVGVYVWRLLDLPS